MQLKDDDRYGLSDAEWKKAQRQSARAAKFGQTVPMMVTLIMFTFIMAIACWRWKTGALTVGSGDVAMIIIIAIYMVMGACCLVRLRRNVARGGLFTQANARLLHHFEMATSMMLAFVVAVADDLPFWAYFALGMGLMGCAMLGLFEYFIRQGVKMEEEQQLTV